MENVRVKIRQHKTRLRKNSCSERVDWEFVGFPSAPGKSGQPPAMALPLGTSLAQLGAGGHPGIALVNSGSSAIADTPPPVPPRNRPPPPRPASLYCNVNNNGQVLQQQHQQRCQHDNQQQQRQSRHHDEQQQMQHRSKQPEQQPHRHEQPERPKHKQAQQQQPRSHYQQPRHQEQRLQEHQRQLEEQQQQLDKKQRELDRQKEQQQQQKKQLQQQQQQQQQQQRQQRPHSAETGLSVPPIPPHQRQQHTPSPTPPPNNNPTQHMSQHNSLYSVPHQPSDNPYCALAQSSSIKPPPSNPVQYAVPHLNANRASVPIPQAQAPSSNNTNASSVSSVQYAVPQFSSNANRASVPAYSNNTNVSSVSSVLYAVPHSLASSSSSVNPMYASIVPMDHPMHAASSRQAAPSSSSSRPPPQPSISPAVPAHRSSNPPSNRSSVVSIPASNDHPWNRSVSNDPPSNRSSISIPGSTSSRNGSSASIPCAASDRSSISIPTSMDSSMQSSVWSSVSIPASMAPPAVPPHLGPSHSEPSIGPGSSAWNVVRDADQHKEEPIYRMPEKRKKTHYRNHARSQIEVDLEDHFRAIADGRCRVNGAKVNRSRQFKQVDEAYKADVQLQPGVNMDRDGASKTYEQETEIVNDQFGASVDFGGAYNASKVIDETQVSKDEFLGASRISEHVMNEVKPGYNHSSGASVDQQHKQQQHCEGTSENSFSSQVTESVKGGDANRGGTYKVTTTPGGNRETEAIRLHVDQSAVFGAIRDFQSNSAAASGSQIPKSIKVPNDNSDRESGDKREFYLVESNAAKRVNEAIKANNNISKDNQIDGGNKHQYGRVCQTAADGNSKFNQESFESQDDAEAKIDKEESFDGADRDDPDQVDDGLGDRSSALDAEMNQFIAAYEDIERVARAVQDGDLGSVSQATGDQNANRSIAEQPSPSLLRQSADPPSPAAQSVDVLDSGSVISAGAGNTNGPNRHHEGEVSKVVADLAEVAQSVVAEGHGVIKPDGACVAKQQGAVSKPVDRSQSLKDQYKRNVRDRRKHSDPSLPPRPASDIELGSASRGGPRATSSTSSTSISTLSQSAGGSEDLPPFRSLPMAPMSSSSPLPSLHESSAVHHHYESLNEVDPYSDDSDMDTGPEAADWRQRLDQSDLERMGKRGTNRQDIINELFHTERSHVRNLKVLERVFYLPLLDGGHMEADLLRRLFPNLGDVLAWHNRANAAMKDAVRFAGFPVGNVVGILAEMFDGESGERLVEIGSTFTKSQAFTMEELKENRRKDNKLDAFIQEQEKKPQCRRLQLQAILPVEHQRLVKYPLLLDQLAKHADDDEAEAVRRLAERTRHILERIDALVAEEQNRQRLADVQKSLDTSGLDRDRDRVLYEEYRNVDLTTHRLIYDGPLTLKLADGKRFKNLDIHVLLLEECIMLLHRHEDKYSLRYFSATLPGQTGSKVHLSPVIKFTSMHVRTVATDKKGIYILHTTGQTPHFYELLASSTADRASWYRQITEASTAFKTREANLRLGLGATGTSTTSSTRSLEASEGNQSQEDGAVGVDQAAGGQEAPGAGSAASDPFDAYAKGLKDYNKSPTHRSGTSSVDDAAHPADDESATSVAVSRGPSNVSETRRKKLVKMDVTKVVEQHLIDPSQVKVTQNEVFVAESVASPIERLRRKEAEISSALKEKRSLIAEILHVPLEDFDHVADIAAHNVASASDASAASNDDSVDEKEKDGRDAKEVLLAALAQAESLSDLVNESLRLHDNTSVSVQTAAGVTSQQQPLTSSAKLISISTSLNSQLAALLSMVVQRDEEFHSLQLELQRSQERIRSMLITSSAEASMTSLESAATAQSEPPVQLRDDEEKDAQRPEREVTLDSSPQHLTDCDVKSEKIDNEEVPEGSSGGNDDGGNDHDDDGEDAAEAEDRLHEEADEDCSASL